MAFLSDKERTAADAVFQQQKEKYINSLPEYQPPPPPPPRPDLLEEFLWALAQMGVEDCIKTFTEVRRSVTELVEKRMIEGQDNISRENIQVNFCRDFLEGAFNGTNNKPSTFPHR